MEGTHTSGSFSDIVFKDIDIQEVVYGTYTLSDATGGCAFTDVTVTLKTGSSGSEVQNNSSQFTIQNNVGNTGL